MLGEQLGVVAFHPQAPWVLGQVVDPSAQLAVALQDAVVVAFFPQGGGLALVDCH